MVVPMRTITLLILSLIWSAAAADKEAPSPPAPASNNVEAPLHSENVSPGLWQPRIIAEVFGTAVEFVLDTGAEGSVLPASFLPHFPKREEGTVNDSNGMRRAYNVGATAVALGKKNVGEFSFTILGEYISLVHGKEVWDTNPDGIGLFGQNIIGSFRQRIDGPKGKLVLMPDTEPLQGSGWVEYTGFNGSPHLTVDAKNDAWRGLACVPRHRLRAVSNCQEIQRDERKSNSSGDRRNSKLTPSRRRFSMATPICNSRTRANRTLSSTPRWDGMFCGTMCSKYLQRRSVCV